MAHHSRADIIEKLLTPSIASGVAACITSLAAGVVVASALVAQDAVLLPYQQAGIKAASGNIEAASSYINNSEFVANAVVFFVWFTIGIMAFTMLEAIWRSLKSGYQLEQAITASASTAQRRTITGDIVLHMAVRLLGVVILYGCYEIVIWVLPHILVFVAETPVLWSFRGGVSILTVMLLALFAAHSIVISLRLAAYRLRLFGQSGWLDVE